MREQMNRISSLVLLGAGVLVAVAPLLLGPFRLSVLTDILILGLLAMSVNLLVGFSDLVTVGQAAYFGVAGYACALVSLHFSSSALVTLAAGILAAGVVGLLTGALAVRTSDTTFIMITIAYAQISFILAQTWVPVTGGDNGIGGIPVPSLPFWIPLDLGHGSHFYWFVLILCILVYFIVSRLLASPFGLVLSGVKSSPDRMTALGYSVYWRRTTIFAIAASIAGMGGALSVQKAQFVSPESTGFPLSALAFLMVLIGGTGRLGGGFVGATVLVLLRDELSSVFDAWLLLLGLILIVMVYLAPKGILGLLAPLFKGADRGGADGVGPSGGRSAFPKDPGHDQVNEEFV